MGPLGASDGRRSRWPDIERAALMQAAGLGNGEQAGGSMLSSRATITEADLAPLYAGFARHVRAVIVGSDASMLQKVNSRSACSNNAVPGFWTWAIRAVQMGLRPEHTTPLEANRPLQHCGPVDQSAAKLVPQAEQDWHVPTTHPAESLGGRLLGEIQNAQEVSFQWAQQNCALPW